MAEADAAQPLFGQDSGNAAPPHQAHDCAESVLKAYSAAAGRSKNQRGAFDAAVRTYLLYHPNMAEEAARLAVARIISWKE
jgi:hypothetical protein